MTREAAEHGGFFVARLAKCTLFQGSQPVGWAGKPNNLPAALAFALGFAAFSPTYELLSCLTPFFT